MNIYYDNSSNGDYNERVLERVFIIRNEPRKLNGTINTAFSILNEISETSRNEVKENSLKGGNFQYYSLFYRFMLIIGPDTILHTKKENIESAYEQKEFIENQILNEQIPFDINLTNSEVKIVLNMPGIDEKDIRVSVSESKVKIKTSFNARKSYHKIIDLPAVAKSESMSYRYNNGILEISFDKTKNLKSQLQRKFIYLAKTLSAKLRK